MSINLVTRSLAHRRASVLVVALLGLAVAACSPANSGSSSSERKKADGLSSSAATEITKALDTARQAPAFVAPGPAVDAGGLDGKKVFVLTDGTNEFLTTFAKGVKGAAEALGMQVEEGNGNSNTSEDVRLLTTAVNKGVDAIIIVASDPLTLASGVKKAKAAGIPVIETFQGDAGAPSAAAKELGIVAHASFCYTCTGELMAASELDAWGSKTTTYLQQLKGYPSSDAVVAGYTKAVERWCGDCKVTLQDIPITTDNSAQVSAAAQTAAQDPKTTTIATVFDYMLGFSEPVVKSAGATDRVHLVSENANLAQLTSLKKGAPYSANVGASVEWAGWAAMDQTVRALLGKGAVDDEKIPLRLFDRTNIDSIDLKADPAEWYVADFRSGYKKLWGLAG